MGTQIPQEVMTLSTMHGLNDLGSISQCQHGTIGDWATYSTLSINVTHIPVSLISGLCLPVECSQQNLTDFGNEVSEKLVNLVRKAQKKFDIFNFDKGYGLIKDYSRVYVTMT